MTHPLMIDFQNAVNELSSLTHCGQMETADDRDMRQRFSISRWSQLADNSGGPEPKSFNRGGS